MKKQIQSNQELKEKQIELKEELEDLKEFRKKINSIALKIAIASSGLLLLCLISLGGHLLNFSLATIYMGFIGGVGLTTSILALPTTTLISKISESLLKSKIKKNDKLIINSKKVTVNSKGSSKKISTPNQKNIISQTRNIDPRNKSSHPNITPATNSTQSKTQRESNYSYKPENNQPKPEQPQMVIVNNQIGFKYQDGTIIIPTKEGNKIITNNNNNKILIKKKNI